MRDALKIPRKNTAAAAVIDLMLARTAALLVFLPAFTVFSSENQRLNPSLKWDRPRGATAILGSIRMLRLGILGRSHRYQRSVFLDLE